MCDMCIVAKDPWYAGVGAVIADLQMYASALTAEQVRILANETSPRMPGTRGFLAGRETQVGVIGRCSWADAGVAHV